MNKHNWIDGKCTLCKISRCFSNGLDHEEPWKNRGFPEASEPFPPVTTFYMLNDGKMTVTTAMPECSGEQKEQPLPETSWTEHQGIGVLTLK